LKEAPPGLPQAGGEEKEMIKKLKEKI